MIRVSQLQQVGRGASIDYGQEAERNLPMSFRIHGHLLFHLIVTLLLVVLAAMALGLL